MKAKIGTKIMISYIFILTITVGIVFVVSALTIGISLRRVERNELKKQGQAIAEVLEEGLENQGLLKAINAMELVNISQMTNAEVFIVSKGGRVLYSRRENIYTKEVQRILQNETGISKVISRVKINNQEGYTVGSVILYSNTAYIERINEAIRWSMSLPLGIAFCIAMLIAFLLQRSITRPLKQLRDDMLFEDIEKKKGITQIRTGDEIEDLSKIFEEMLHRIQEDVVNRRKVFQNTSHELKSPLMSIQGYAEAIKDGIVEGDEIEKSLDIIINKSKELTTTVDEVLYLSRIENHEQKIQKEIVDLEAYVVDWKLCVEGLVEESGLEISLDLETFNNVQAFNDKRFDGIFNNVNVEINVEQFSHVFNNLLENALRYAKKEIKVGIGIQEKDAIISFIDDGDGLDENSMGQLFDRFYKGLGGKSGLGLYIVKLIVENHGGRIRAFNGEVEGAVFEIRLPLFN